MLPTLFQPIDRRSVTDKIQRQLTDVIQRKEYTTGDFLPSERGLAERLGVSRVVVREATKRLEQSGVVRIRPGIGVEVINNHSFPVQGAIHQLLPSPREQFQQGAQARLLVEGEVAALAATHGESRELTRLRHAHEALEAEDDLPAAVGHDIDFHAIIAELSGNKVLGIMLQSIAELGRKSREITIRRFGVEKAFRHHAAILEAIEARDPDAARRAMRHHLEAAYRDLAGPVPAPNPTGSR